MSSAARRVPGNRRLTTDELELLGFEKRPGRSSGATGDEWAAVGAWHVELVFTPTLYDGRWQVREYTEGGRTAELGRVGLPWASWPRTAGQLRKLAAALSVPLRWGRIRPNAVNCGRQTPDAG